MNTETTNATIEATTIMATMADLASLTENAVLVGQAYVSGYGAATSFIRDTLSVYRADSVLSVLNAFRSSGGKEHDKSLATIVARELKTIGLQAVSRKGEFVAVTPIAKAVKAHKAETHEQAGTDTDTDNQAGTDTDTDNQYQIEISRLKAKLAEYERAFALLEQSAADSLADMARQRDAALARAVSAEKRLAAYAAREKAKQKGTAKAVA